MVLGKAELDQAGSKLGSERAELTWFDGSVLPSRLMVSFIGQSRSQDVCRDYVTKTRPILFLFDL